VLPRFIGRYFGAHVTAVELDPVVCDFAGRYLGFKPSESLSVVTAEGMEYIRGCKDGRWDIAILDVNAQSPDNPLEAPPEEFVTKEALAHLARVTEGGGVAVINMLCSDEALFDTIISRVQDAFHGTVCTLRGIEEDADENCVVFAVNRHDPSWPPPLKVLQERVEKLENAVPQLKQFGLSTRMNDQWRVVTRHRSKKK